MSNHRLFEEDDGVSVVELESFQSEAAVFAGLLNAYQDQGYDRGYQRAMANALGSLVFFAEDFLRERRIDDAGQRKLLHDFVVYVERHLSPVRQSSFVSDGLGI